MKIFVLLAVVSSVRLAHGLDLKNTSGQVHVGKVVQLLTELKARVEADGRDEQASYDKFACWCEQITQKRASDITKAKEDIQRFGNNILELKGDIATKIAEVKELTKDIRTNEEGQRTATALRQKENEAFVAESTECQEAIAALQAAITVLKDGSTTASFLQQGAAERLPAALHAVHVAVEKVVSHSSPHAAASSKQLSALKTAESKRYAPQSMTIQGILRNMYDTFTTNLEVMTADEAKAHANYEGLMATWQEELATLKADVLKKDKFKAEAEIQLTDTVQAYEDTQASLASGIELFDATKDSCIAKTTEWSERKALRTDELAGIEKALEILSSDEAREMFGKATNFFQVSSSAAPKNTSVAPVAKALSAAGKALQDGAKKSRSVRLASLAAAVHAGRLGAVGHFDEVIKTIDTLISTIQQEEVNDDKLAATCKEQYHEYNLKTEELQWTITKMDAEVKKLEQELVKDREQLDSLNTEISNLQGDLASMETTRKDENTKYLAGKDDDQKAIDLLESAKAALVEYFEKHQIDMNSVLLQKKNVSETAPDTTFSGGGSRKLEHKGVVSLIENIIADLQTEIAGSQRAEAQAQLDYEKQKEASEKLLADLNTTKVNLDGEIAEKDQDKTDMEATVTDSQTELDGENTAMTNLKTTCDSRIENLGDRKKKRAVEIEALQRAKEYLAGAGPVLALGAKNMKVVKHKL